MCDNIENDLVTEIEIKNKIIHTVQEENDNLTNNIMRVDKMFDISNHDVEFIVLKIL